MEVMQIEDRIDALDRKMDLILAQLQAQNQRSEVVDDLVSDLNIIGKDIYHSTVEELENRQLKVDQAELVELMMLVVRNIDNFKAMINGMEMAVDLGKEMGPIANEMIIDGTKKMHELDQKGYFSFIKEVGPILDNIVTGFSPSEVKELAENIVSILKLIKEMTQPEVLTTVQNAVKAFNSMETESVPSYSVWKLMREMNSPEMQKALGFGITFMKNVSKDVEITQ